MAASADLVICPYNYLLSPGRRFLTGPTVAVVFDEGHNIDNFCRSECSLSIQYNHIHIAGNDAARAPPGSEFSHIFRFVRQLTFGWLRFINRHREEYNRHANDAKYISDVSFEKLIAEWGYSPDELRTASECLSEWASRIDADPKGYTDYLTAPLLTFAEEIGAVLQLIERENTKDFRVAYLPGDVPEFDRIAILCLRPALMFHKVADAARAVIITSGTLSPFNALTAELETRFDVIRSAPHVVEDSQVLTISINRHNSLPLTSQYRQMNEKGEETFAALGHVVAQLLQVVPGGALLFVPSYSAKRQFLDVIERNGTRRRIAALKEIVEEESSKSGRDIVAEMDNCPRGGLLVGVCRGKMSEGMDFPDDRARIVFVFGIPYASFKEADVDLKMQYNDEMSKTKKDFLSGRSWYETQAFRALSQALGRCVRHTNDYGAIILMDWRIDQHMDQFPLWIRRNVRRDITADAAAVQLACFYTAMHQRFPGFSAPPRPSTMPYTVKSPIPQPQKLPPAPPISASQRAPIVAQTAPIPAPQRTPIVAQMGPNPVQRTLPRPLNDPKIVLYCVNCAVPVIGLENLGVAHFATVSKRGYLAMSKNTVMPSVTVITIAAAVPLNLHAKLGDPQFSAADSCAYEEVVCHCGCVVGLRVAAAGVGSVFESGTVTLLVRCLSIKTDGKMVALEQLARLIG
jgi:Rad3-related DNA helicase